MAWFNFDCPEHGQFRLSLKKREKTATCPKCGQESKNIIGVGSARVVEVIDTGTQPRKVEWLKDIMEIIDERDKKFN